MVTGVVVLVSGTLLSVLDIAVHGKRVGVVEEIWQTLLELRQFREADPDPGSRINVLARALDVRDVRRARVAGAEDLIVSERITALMLAQLAEIRDREKVFADLLQTTGSEVSTRPLSDDADPRPGLPYGAYVAAAHRSGHLPIGHRSTGARAVDLSQAIHLDPPKSASVDLQPDDQLVIVAGRDRPSAAAVSRRTTPQLVETSA